MRSHHFFGAAASLVLAAILIAGCSKDNKSLSPFQPEISNVQDNFQFQATGVTNVSTTVEYAWLNTGTSANINQACSIISGSALLSILDANGTEVYTRSLADNGTFPSIQGVTGMWTIRVDLYNIHGNLNFRVQKP